MTLPRITLAQLLFPRLRRAVAEIAFETGRYYSTRRLP